MKEEPIMFRFRGLRKDGAIIQSNSIDDFKLQDFHWFEEISYMTKEMWQMLKDRVEIPYISHLSSPLSEEEGRNELK